MIGSLAGSGLISADGGAGNALGGGGGGGRIAVVYTSANAFSGLMSAHGGGGYAWGGAGTIYTKASNQSLGLVTVDNGGQFGTNTSLSGNFDLTIKGGAVVAVSYNNLPTVGTLLVASNGWLVSTGSIAYPVLLTISGNATIQAGGGITADGTGYASGSGTGAGRTYQVGNPYGYVGGGGGYGGYGASGGGTTLAYGGITYGSLTAPVDMGSGGGGYTGTQLPPAAGGAGGGVVRLSVIGTLQVDGTLSARGMAGTGPCAGGGSGGSIYLAV
jgi:hypothetical protein